VTHSSHMTRRAVAGGLLAGGTLLVGGAMRAQSGGQPNLPSTPESPMGPFYPVQHSPDHDADMVTLRGRGRARGDVIEVGGRVLDLHGRPVSGAQVEIWQANAVGRYAHPADVATAPLDPNFSGFASLRTGRDGVWRVTTIRPAGYSSPIGDRPPHIHFMVSGRAHRLVAQMYFPENAAANARDVLYQSLGGEGPRSVATRAEDHRYRWDIVLLES
jgi:protocatechuate 3,4-dioxygenase beta subunit